MPEFHVPADVRVRTRTLVLVVAAAFALGAWWAWSRADGKIDRLKEAGRIADSTALARLDSAEATIGAMDDSLQAIKKQKQRIITIARTDSATVAKLDSALARATDDSSRIAILTEQNEVLKSENLNLWAAVALADSATANAERQRDVALDALRDQTAEVVRLNAKIQGLSSRMPTWVRVGSYVVTFGAGVYAGVQAAGIP